MISLNTILTFVLFFTFLVITIREKKRCNATCIRLIPNYGSEFLMQYFLTGSHPAKLQKARLPIVDNDICDRWNNEDSDYPDLQIVDTQICAG